MRKTLISLMAASMLVPAAAQAEDGGLLRGMRAHAERSSQRDDKSDNRSSRAESRSERSNSDRGARVERAPREDRAPRVERVERAQNIDDGDRGGQRIERVSREDRGVQRVERSRRGDRDVQQVEQVQVTEPVQSRQQTERRFDGLAGAFGRAGRDMAEGRTSEREGDRNRDRDWRRDRDGDRDWRRDRDGRHRWDRDWRRDGRYDWWTYRNRYRNLFRLGRYYDPYGWGYRRFSIGFSLWPSYYNSSRYWIHDPWMYRLPYAPPGYRWIRYYDDALLVDTWSGQVVDVIHNFFW